MKNLMSKLVRDEQGGEVLEYALIVGLIVVAAIAIVVVYLMVMRVFSRDSSEADKHIDYSKVKKWKDDD